MCVCVCVCVVPGTVDVQPGCAWAVVAQALELTHASISETELPEPEAVAAEPTYSERQLREALRTSKTMCWGRLVMRLTGRRPHR